MKRLEETHPGTKNEIEEIGLPVCKNDFGMRKKKQQVDIIFCTIF